MITNIRKKVSRRKLFNNLKILTQPQYIVSLLRFVCNNKDWYTRNLEIHDRNTRYGSDFYYATSNLVIYHKSTYYIGLKVFNNLPSPIKEKLQDIKEFKRLIKIFLYCNTFNTLAEYFNYNKKKHIMKIFNISYIVSVRELLCFCLLNHHCYCSIAFMLIIIFLLF